MRFWQHEVEVKTQGRGLENVTHVVADLVARTGAKTGLCHVFVKHTSASLVIQENADPAVRRDLERWIEGIAPESAAWEHDDEGPDDMPAHARAAMTKTSEVLPIVNGKLGLGTWQALYLWEHRARPHTRTLVITVSGT